LLGADNRRGRTLGLRTTLPSRHLRRDPRLQQFDLHTREQIGFCLVRFGKIFL